MILLFGIAAAVVVALLRGGNLRNLGDIHIRWAWLALLALAIQLIAIRFMLDWLGPARVLLPVTHMVIVAVAWANRDLDGMWLLAAGVALNLVVIAANGGFMPITPALLAQVGIAESIDSIELHTRLAGSENLILARGETALWWLSDIIPLRFPIGTVVSIGDILISAGIFLFIQGAILQQEG